MNMCNHDCFNCVFDDCIEESSTKEELSWQAKIDREIKMDNADDKIKKQLQYDEHRLERKRNRYKDDKEYHERKKAYNREWAKNHRAERSKSSSEWQRRNKEKVSEYHRKYYAEHKEEIAEKAKKKRLEKRNNNVISK